MSDEDRDTIVRWGEPPPPGRRRTAEITLELQEHPGEWALIAEKIESTYAEQSKAKNYRRQGCQVITRRHGDGTSDVWARWPK